MNQVLRIVNHNRLFHKAAHESLATLVPVYLAVSSEFKLSSLLPPIFYSVILQENVSSKPAVGLPLFTTCANNHCEAEALVISWKIHYLRTYFKWLLYINILNCWQFSEQWRFLVSLLKWFYPDYKFSTLLDLTVDAMHDSTYICSYCSCWSITTIPAGLLHLEISFDLSTQMGIPSINIFITVQNMQYLLLRRIKVIMRENARPRVNLVCAAINYVCKWFLVLIFLTLWNMSQYILNAYMYAPSCNSHWNKQYCVKKRKKSKKWGGE